MPFSQSLAAARAATHRKHTMISLGAIRCDKARVGHSRRVGKRAEKESEIRRTRHRELIPFAFRYGQHDVVIEWQQSPKSPAEMYAIVVVVNLTKVTG